MSVASLYPTEYLGCTRDPTNVSYVLLSSVITSKSLSSLPISTIMNAHHVTSLAPFPELSQGAQPCADGDMSSSAAWVKGRD